MSNIKPIDVRTEVEMLVKKAAEAPDSGDAMRFSQAACNAANAMIGINDLASDKANSLSGSVYNVAR